MIQVGVRTKLIISRLLAAFALLGLVLAPLASSAVASTDMAQVQTQEQAQHEMHGGPSAAMPDEMPCYPDGMPAPASDCGKHCLMAMCAAPAMLTIPGVTWRHPSILASHQLAAGDVAAMSGVPIGPPPEPPKA